MTKGNSSSTRKIPWKYFKSELRSHWWMMLITGIVYFLAGPMVMWMWLSNTAKNSYITETEKMLQLSENIQSWFMYEGLISYYVIAMIIGALLPMVLFGYLNSKKQVNFYHSLPISRKALFANNTLLGVAVNFIPMLLATAVTVGIALVYGQWSDIDFGNLCTNLAYIFVYFMLSYALALLATQLTGTALTQIAMTGVLHFIVLAIWGCVLIAMESFYGTFNAYYDGMIYWSPITNFAAFANSQYYWNEQLVLLPWKQLIVMVAITVILLALAWAAYQKRPSESAGQPIVFGFMKPILKLVVMFCATGLAGILFMEIGGGIFFFVGLLLAAILVHMFMEVIYHKDFKAMLKNKPAFFIMTGAMLVVYGSMYFDLTGFDSYLPKEEKVAAIKTDLMPSVNTVHITGEDGNYKEQYFVFDSEEGIEKMMAFLTNIVEDEVYIHGNHRGERPYYTTIKAEKVSYITIVYVLESGREVRREYRGIPLMEYAEELDALYNTADYGENMERMLAHFDDDRMTYYGIHCTGNSYAAWGNGYSANERTIESDPYLHEVYAAVCKDVKERTSEVLYQPALYQVQFEERRADIPGRIHLYGYVYLPIYATDEHTLAVIDRMVADEEMVVQSYADKLREVSYVEIYEVVEDDVDMSSLNYDEEYLKKVAQLQRIVTDEAEILSVLEQTVTRDGYINSPLMEVDEEKFARIVSAYAVEDGVYHYAKDVETQAVYATKMQNEYQTMYYPLERNAD